MIKLEVESKNFPSDILKSGQVIEFTQAELCWASITMGRRNKAAVKGFPKYTSYETNFRWRMVQSALDFSCPTGHLKNSPLFDDFDRTEKVCVNYFLGMVFAKLCAELLLDIPWLVHYSSMKNAGSLKSIPGMSSPDFLGLHPESGDWHVFEAKGRGSNQFKPALRTALEQARRNITVDNKPCKLRIGSVLYRDKKHQNLQFIWEDPPNREEEICFVETDRNTWGNYYATAFHLQYMQSENREAFQKEFGFNIDLDKTLMCLYKNREAVDREFNKAMNAVKLTAKERRGSRERDSGEGSSYSMDGIKISNLKPQRSV